MVIKLIKTFTKYGGPQKVCVLLFKLSYIDFIIKNIHIPATENETVVVLVKLVDVEDIELLVLTVLVAVSTPFCRVNPLVGCKEDSLLLTNVLVCNKELLLLIFLLVNDDFLSAKAAKAS